MNWYDMIINYYYYIIFLYFINIETDTNIP